MLVVFLLSLMIASPLELPPSPARDDAHPLGLWRGCLMSPGGDLAFGIEFRLEGGGLEDERLEASILNGEESITVPDVTWKAGELRLSFPHYDSEIVAVKTKEGALEGTWTKILGEEKSCVMTFRAEPGPRRIPSSAEQELDDPRPFQGRFAVRFESSPDPAVAIFLTDDQRRVHGTFLTTTGDYRFLEGAVLDGILRLTCFDGAHAFLFEARTKDDGGLEGDFWSRDSWHETWSALRDPNATIADGFDEVTWNPDVSLGDLVFPDLDGKMWRLDDPELLGRFTLIQVFGSWCPNCHDETRFLVELFHEYRAQGLQVVGVAFELGGGTKRDVKQLERFRDHLRVPFPLLLAGPADKTEATKVFRGLSRIKSYPTTLFVDAQGQIRDIHSGFSGEATGDAHRRLRNAFEQRVKRGLDVD